MAITKISIHPSVLAENNSQRRIVPIGEHTLGLEPQGHFRRFRIAIYCFIPTLAPQEQNEISNHLYCQFFVDSHGEFIANTAQILAGINLQIKENGGVDLRGEEIQKLEAQAEKIKQNLESLKKMVQHIRSYQDSLLPINESVLSQCDQMDCSVRENISIEVVKRSGTTEFFQEEKLEKSLRKTPFERPLNETEIRLITERISTQILEARVKKVSTTAIRELIRGEIQSADILVTCPEFLDEIQNQEIRSRLLIKKGVEELEPDECATLITILDGYLYQSQ